MAALIRAGLIDLDAQEVKTFPLEQANEAVAYAAAHSGPSQVTVLTMF